MATKSTRNFTFQNVRIIEPVAFPSSIEEVKVKAEELGEAYLIG
ncbi:MAG TPA: hypothetical protein VJ110_02040 [Candidatus Nanoarchaeia archaeon]|nr:hypothetical protein [Candidatus Nanoarchaeia archaeon]